MIAQELAAQAAPIARLGDGNCGEVLSIVIQALIDAGLYQCSAVRAKSCTKAAIKQSIRTQVFERDFYRCLHCGTHKDLTVDHIHPESLGGSLELGNLQTLCRSCNSSKGVR